MKLRQVSKANMKYAVEILNQGKVVVYPTDTAYALGADPLNARAIARIYNIKGRDKKKPLPLIATSREMVKRFFAMSKIERKLAEKYWPGPLSIILEIRKKKNGIRNTYSHILQNMRIQDIAVRVPRSKISRELARLLGRPIVSTSANISGAGEFYSAKKIYKHFENRKYKPDFILDAGSLRKRQPSTIIKVVDDTIILLRKGPIKI